MGDKLYLSFELILNLEYDSLLNIDRSAYIVLEELYLKPSSPVGRDFKTYFTRYWDFVVDLWEVELTNP